MIDFLKSIGINLGLTIAGFFGALLLAPKMMPTDPVALLPVNAIVMTLLTLPTDPVAPLQVQLVFYACASLLQFDIFIAARSR